MPRKPLKRPRGRPRSLQEGWVRIVVPIPPSQLEIISERALTTGSIAAAVRSFIPTRRNKR